MSAPNLNRFPIERFDEIAARPQDFKLIERIPITMSGLDQRLPLLLNPPVPGEKLHYAVFLDTETTGMDAADKIIELGMVRVTYSYDRKVIISIDRIFDAFEDPGMPIPMPVQQLTHITDSMVQNQHFDEDAVAQCLTGSPIIIAHNASFDRPFFDRRFKQFCDLSWACSMKSVNWEMLGSNGRKLDYLCQTRGWFYDAHRACEDGLALTWLMYIEPQAFAMLLEAAKRIEYKVFANRAPFGIKDELKRMGYRWDNARRTWYFIAQSADEAEQQRVNLGRLYDAGQVSVIKMSAQTRYK